MSYLSKEKMKKIALTGNIGCGKSYVAKIMQSYGVCVFDCDKIAMEVRNQNLETLSKMFHIDAKDTQKLADLVFHDDVKRKQLENFLYPMIQEEILRLFSLHQDKALVVIEIPLVYEKGWEFLFDEIWVVACDEKTAMQRLMKYRNMSEEEATRRLHKQMPLSEKVQRAHVVLYNEEENEIEAQIQCLLKKEGIVHVKAG